MLAKVEKEMNEAIKKEKRRRKLKRLLEEHDLEIRNDSFYCNQYIEDGSFGSKKVVNMMITMDFFVNNTTYNDILHDIYESNKEMRQDARDFGNYDPDFHLINEDDKQIAKEKALKLYLKKYKINSVPLIVREMFL